MKTFTATPDEFQSGQAGAKSRDLFRDFERQMRAFRRSMAAKKPKPKPSDRVREIGTITPAQFQKGDASRHWRTGKIRPLTAEGIVTSMLE